MRHYYDDYDYYDRGYGRDGYYIPPRRRSGQTYGGYGRRAPRYDDRYARDRYYGYSERRPRSRGYDYDYGAINDYARRRRSEYDQYDQYDSQRYRRREEYTDISRADRWTDNTRSYDGGYDEFDLYDGGFRGKRHTGLVIVLLLALIVIASVNVSIFYVSKVMKKIDYQTDNTIEKSVFEVSASDIMSRLPDDGLTGELLNDYHVTVYRHQILKSFCDDARLAMNDPVTNILFISADNENAPADIITLISVDSKNKKVTFTSVMPETGIAYADIEEPLRLSCASVMGGPLLTVYTVQSLLGVRIDKYVMLESDGFAEMIDALGGVKATLTKAESDGYNFYIALDNNEDPYLSEGDNILSGRQAYLFAKFAGAPNDGYAAGRRSELLYETACVLNGASSSKLISAFKAAAPYCHTSFTRKQLLSLMGAYPELHKYNVLTDIMPLDNEYTLVSVNGQGMLRFNDLNRCRKRLMLGALGFDENEAIAAGYILASDNAEQSASDSDAYASPTDING